MHTQLSQIIRFKLTGQSADLYGALKVQRMPAILEEKKVVSENLGICLM